MCGIFGIVLSQQNSENIYNLIINGLIQLQNRGYDSCGLSILNNNNKFEVLKCASTNEINAIDRLLQLINENLKTKIHLLELVIIAGQHTE
jgi:Glucosamine 6-phosphate synthetase, contains amidotransferase and phosphosugar isomerase domains